jgi:hypothetical protein
MGIVTIQLAIDVFRELPVPRNPNYFQQGILPARENGTQLVEGLRVKNAFGDGVAKKVHEFRFTDDQVYPIVTAITVLAKPQSFPSVSVEREEIALDAGLVAVVPMEGTDSALLQGNHFSHKGSSRTTSFQ